MKTRIITLIAAAMIVSLFSCQKDTSLLDDESVNLADDDAFTEAIFEDVFSTADNASIIAEGMTKGEESKSGTEVVVDSCPTITVSRPGPALWPKTITVDYGTGCEGLNDNVRKGKIVIDDGARKAILSKGASLLSPGIIEVQGEFMIKNVIDIIDKNGTVLARGITNYSSQQLNKIKGTKSEKEVVHRNDLVLLE